VKSSGRDELMWVVIHMCIAIILEISLYSYLYLKLAKNAMLFILSLMFSLQQNQRTRGWNRFCPLCSRVGRFNSVKMGKIPKFIYRFTTIMIKISTDFFVGFDKLI
jgi:hypothetical protein